MQNLDQVRVKSVLANTENQSMRAANGGEAIKKIPPMIMNNGLLAAIAFSIEKKGNGEKVRPGFVAIFDEIAKHLNSPEIAVTQNVKDGSTLINFLSESDSQTLKLATAETMLWLNYARRFLGKEK